MAALLWYVVHYNFLIAFDTLSVFKFGVHFCIRLSCLVRSLFAKQNTAEITKKHREKFNSRQILYKKNLQSQKVIKRNISVARSGGLTESKGKFGYFN